MLVSLLSDRITIPQAEKLIDMLRLFSKRDIDLFLERFQIDKVKLLPAKSYEDAVKYIDSLGREES